MVFKNADVFKSIIIRLVFELYVFVLRTIGLWLVSGIGWGVINYDKAKIMPYKVIS